MGNTPHFQGQPYVLGFQVSPSEFALTEDLLAKVFWKGGQTGVSLKPFSNEVTLPTELQDILPIITPILIIEASKGTDFLWLGYGIEERELPWHVDNVGRHGHRRYIMTNIEGETTPFINNPRFYVDENGDPVNLWMYTSPYADMVGVSRPAVHLEDIWLAPTLTYVGFYGDTIHMRPNVSPNRASITVITD